MEIPLLDPPAEMTSAHNRWGQALARIDELEMRVVRQVAGMTQIRLIRVVAIAVTLLGNGWIYVPIVIGVLLFSESNAWARIGAAGIATAVAHVAYAVLKRCVARPRPFERDPTMQPFARVLDHYSFPSGHCMTLTAVLIPVVWGEPNFWPGAITALFVLGWCRIAATHHYPSDILAGIGLGAGVSVPLAAWLVPI
jgi:undecaprenyl-diphosphatase